MARKTYPVADLIDHANRVIDHAKTMDERRAVAHLLESVLHETGNYKGFRYLSSELNDDGRLRDGYDDTNRYYYGGNR